MVSALIGSAVGPAWARLGLGLTVALALPAALRWLAWRQIRRRVDRARPLIGLRWFLVAFNALLLTVICLGFSDATGRAIRRRGDWFVGESQAPIARWIRRGVARAALYMERFDLPEDLPAETRAMLEPSLRPPLPEPPRPPPPGGERPTPPAAEQAVAWYHPLAGPRRRMPPNASCRFGAPRPGRRPAECELGHCGVDLAGPVGTPIYAVHDGVVLAAVRDERRGGSAGRYIKLGHGDGLAKSYYVHLDRLRAHLRQGSRVVGGERIGTIGLTGVKRSAPHLHFGLALRVSTTGRRYRYVDPEPLLRRWRLPTEGPRRELIAAR